MRIVSLVPSWTETLLKAQIQVVGRTRFCIHPAKQMTPIPIVGGTKEVSWDLVTDLKPDLVLFDKEENPLEMAEECPFPYMATHVTCLESLQRELAFLGERFQNAYLMQKSVQCLDIVEAPDRQWDPSSIPGQLEWVNTLPRPTDRVQYVIWKKPWMAAGSKTYIGSVLKKLGAKVVDADDGEKYPVLEDLSDKSLADCLYLFSSEPFPFHKKIQELRALNIPGVVVDGELYSWFGVRSLDFLSRELGLEVDINI